MSVSSNATHWGPTPARLRREAVADLRRYVEEIEGLDDPALAVEAAGALWDVVMSHRMVARGERPPGVEMTRPG